MPNSRQRPPTPYDLDELCGDISVMDGLCDDGPPPDLSGWYAVVTRDGVVAYFGDETMAFSFRLQLINAILNPLPQHPSYAERQENPPEVP